MRRAIVAGLVAVTVGMGVAPETSAAASVRPGGSCRPAGKTVVVAERKYTCVRKGSSTVWNKGVKIARRTPTPPLSPSPSASPQAQESTPASPRQLLFASLADRYAATTMAPAANLQTMLSPLVDRAKASSVINAYTRAMQFWTPLYNAGRPIRWVLMSEQDHAWWRATVTALEGAQGDRRVWDAATGVMGHCNVSAEAFCGYGTLRDVEGELRFIQYNLVGSRSSPTLSGNVVAHEATHLYQYAFAGMLRNTEIPYWMLEGQATFFEVALGNTASPERSRAQHLRDLIRLLPEAPTMSAQQWFDLLTAKEEPAVYLGSYMKYNLGMLAFEYLYLQHSLEEVHAWFGLMASGTDFPAAVQQAFGLPADDLMRRIASYLADEL